MDEAGTNYGACSLVVLLAAGLFGWIGFQLALAQLISMFSGGLLQRIQAASETYGLVGVALIVVAFLTLVWAIALAGAGFAANRGRLFSLLTILIVVSPVFYILLEFVVSLLATGPPQT